MTVFTRADYMNHPRGEGEGWTAHRRFYAQFVNASTINAVVASIGSDDLLASADRYFNDIPIRRWDNAAQHATFAIRFKDVGDFPSEAGLVCVVKEAARQYVESQASPLVESCPRCGEPTDPNWFCGVGYCRDCCIETDEGGDE